MPDRDLDTKPKPFVFVLMPFDEKFDDIYNALGWIGLLAIIFGTLLQAVTVLERK